jgi:hypothetical protein
MRRLAVPLALTFAVVLPADAMADIRFRGKSGVTRDRLVDAGVTRGRIEDGLRAVARVRVAGNRVSERRWRGIFRVNVRVLRGGRVIDRCYKRTRWRVLRRS